MKILIATHHYLNQNGGGAFASRAYINAFSEIYDECTLLYPDNGHSIKPFMSPKVILKGVPYNKHKLLKFIDLYRGKLNRYSDVLMSEISKSNPDIVIFDNSRCSSGYLHLLKKLDIKVITIHHNYEIEYYNTTKPPLLWRFPFMHFMKKTESLAVSHSVLNLTLTPQDLSLLKNNYDVNEKNKFDCLGVFEYESHIEKEVLKDFRSNSLIFAITGSLNSFQTEVSLIPFLNEYFPILKKRYPKSKLIIAGKNPTKKILDLCVDNPDIELFINPKDISEIVKNADIYLCPVSVGGGLKLRIMDGLKNGIPVLSHNVSARGYDVFLEAGYLNSYCDKISFDEKLQELIDRKILRGEVKDLYDKNFSFDAGRERLRSILKNYDLI